MSIDKKKRQRNYQRELELQKEKLRRIEIRVPKEDGEEFVELLKNEKISINSWGHEQIKKYLKEKGKTKIIKEENIMKIMDLENSGLKDFTIKCLNSSKNETKEILKKSNNIEEFINNFLSRKNFRNLQSYWELMKDQKANQLRNSAIEYLLDNNIECITTTSDAGSIKIGNDLFSVQIKNGYGDCVDNNVFIIDNSNSTICLDFANFNTSIEGKNINIYSNDCGNEIAKKLDDTKYFIYSLEKIIILKRYE